MKINNKLIDDTGWIDMSAYVNTTYFSARSGFAPYVRIRNGIAYWKGEILCHTAPNANSIAIMSGIPSSYLPRSSIGSQQVNGCGMRWETGDTYSTYIASNGDIRIGGTNIKKTTSSWQGYQLSCIPPYPID